MKKVDLTLINNSNLFKRYVDLLQAWTLLKEKYCIILVQGWFWQKLDADLITFKLSEFSSILRGLTKDFMRF